MIYDEVKRVNERLRLIEDIIEEVITKRLPEVALSKEKIKEIERSVQEMKKVSCQVSNVTPFILSVSMAVCLVMV